MDAYGITLQLGDIVVVDDNYWFREVKIRAGDEVMSVGATDDDPSLVELLEYFALVAESVELTTGIPDWLESYGHNFCREKSDLDNVAAVYAECVVDMLRLKKLLGPSAYATLLDSVGPARAIH